VTIEDNTVGYDILFYGWHEGREVNRRIEVQRTFTAQQYDGSFAFHLWSFPSRPLTNFDVDQIQTHIPVDQRDGLWQVVEILPMSSS
jgi:hypothetical protein